MRFGLSNSPIFFEAWRLGWGIIASHRTKTAEEEHLVFLSDVKFKTAKCFNIWGDRRRDSSLRALRRLLGELTRIDTFSNVSQVRLIFFMIV